MSGFATFWPGFGTGGAMKRDLSNIAPHPDETKHTKVLRGDGEFVEVSESGGGVSWSNVPASASATGTAGEMAYDTEFFYVCVATNTWRRIPLAEW